MSAVPLRHTAHTAEHRVHNKGLFCDTPSPLFRSIFESTCLWKDVFSQNGLAQHVARRFPGSCLCPLHDNSIKNSGDTARYRLGPPRPTRFNYRRCGRTAVSCRMSQETAQTCHMDNTSCVTLCVLSCVHVKCQVRLLRAFLEEEGGEEVRKRRKPLPEGTREWHTFAPQFSRSHVP